MAKIKNWTPFHTTSNPQEAEFLLNFLKDNKIPSQTNKGTEIIAESPQNMAINIEIPLDKQNEVKKLLDEHEIELKKPLGNEKVQQFEKTMMGLFGLVAVGFLVYLLKDNGVF